MSGKTVVNSRPSTTHQIAVVMAQAHCNCHYLPGSDRMLKTAKLVCFVATAKPALAKRFYRDTLGLSFAEDNPFAIIFHVNGTTLRVQKVRGVSPAGYTAVGWEVDDIRETVQRLSKKGIHFERYDGMSQDES